MSNSLKDNNISLDKLLTEINQKQRVEELLNQYGLSTKNEQDDLFIDASKANESNNQFEGLDFKPLSNNAINPKRDRLVKIWVYTGVFILGFILFFTIVGAYIDFYKYYTTNDSDYLSLQELDKKSKLETTETESIMKLNQ